MAKGKVPAKAGKAGEKKGEVVPVRALPPASVWEQEFDRLFDRMLEDFRRFTWPSLLGPERWWPAFPRLRMPAMDVYEEADQVVVKADVPGVSKDDIEITLAGSALTIRGERKKEEKVKEHDFFRQERSREAFARTVQLPADVKAEEVKATFKDGVLEVRMPKTEEAKRKVIKVQVD